MSPTPYNRIQRLTQYGTAIPGTIADVELDAVETAIDSTQASLALIQRGDGRLNNGLVSPDSLSSQVTALMGGWNPRGAWATSSNYAAKDFVEQPFGSGNNYVCVTGHTAGVFATDLAAGKWTVVSGVAIAPGLAGQLAVYATAGIAVSGTSALPNGITATTQAAGDATGAVATDAFVAAAVALASGKVKIQTFDVGGGLTQTYTPSPGMVTALGFCWGGGGGGGGVASGGSATGVGGGGGGAGSLSIKLMTAAQVGASKTVTLGAAGVGATAGSNAGGNGGDTSIGTLCVAKGATGGAGGTDAAGGLGGVAGTGDVTFNGAPGHSTLSYPGGSTNGLSGAGGSSLIGGGGRAKNSAGSSANGEAETGRAAGGGGGASYNGAAAGGAATAGHCFIIEFCNQ